MLSKDYPTFFTSIPNSSVEYLTPLKSYTPPAVLCNTYRITQPVVTYEKESSVHRITEAIAAHVCNLENAVTVDAMLKWAKEQELTELILLGEESVRHALMREVPNLRDCGDGVYRCGFCESRVLAGDSYCRCCGQRVR